MAQLDFLIIFPLLWPLILVLAMYYNISITNLIPSFFGVKKFREKIKAVNTKKVEEYKFGLSTVKSTYCYSIF